MPKEIGSRPASERVEFVRWSGDNLEALNFKKAARRKIRLLKLRQAYGFLLEFQ
jgi:hypothetical protein